jgi:hypothetical protein
LATLVLGPGRALAGLEGPAIRYEYREVEFGVMEQRTERDTVFTFTNIGDEPLRILDVRTSCGCTAALASEDVISPGAKGTIKVTFNSKSFRGNVTKTVIVTSNDPSEPKTNLKVMADVRPTVNYSPTAIDLGVVRRGEKATRSIRLASEKSKPITLKEVKLSEEHFTWTQRQEAHPESTVYVMDVSLLASAPMGRMSERLIVDPGIKNAKPIIINIRGEIVNHFLAKPSQVNFGSFRRGKAESKIIVVERVDDTSFKVESVQSTHPQIQTRLEAESGGAYKIYLDIDPDVVPGRLNARVLIKTTDPEEPVLTVPIQGYVRGEG